MRQLLVGAEMTIALFAAMVTAKCAVNGAARPVRPAVINYWHLENRRNGTARSIR
jgi:hypothetical protein